MANWTDFMTSRPVSTMGDRERKARPKRNLPAWLQDYESWITFAVVLIVFLTVARSVDNANWVRRMPSLIGLSFAALLTGLGLARIRAPEVVLHVLSLFIGVALIMWLTMRFVDAGSLTASFAEWKDRWAQWIHEVRNSEPVTDNMPFVMFVLAFTWIAAYLSAWSIFRWRNAWLALVPAGIGLLTNISYLPGQHAAEFIIFLAGAMLLVMRVFLINKMREWDARGIEYPGFLSWRLLNITTWVALAALIVAWRIPQANEVGPVASAWERISGPLGGDSDQFVRLFSNIDAKKEVPLHNFGDVLALQGKVILGSKIAAQVEFGEASNLGRPLRLKTYDEYTGGGWKAGPRAEVEVGPAEQVPAANAQRAQYRDRQEVTGNFIYESGFPKNSLPTVGQPVTTSQQSSVQVIATDPIPDIDGVRSRSKLKLGDSFTTTGTVSTATEAKLRAAGGNYPAYINDRYLQLPASLPPRVRQLAADITKDAPTPFDKAKAIEQYLRTFQSSFDINSTPPGRDAVDYFLFDQRKGYFDYQASAMVVLLRAAGVPARLAVGYQIDEFDLTLRRFLLRDKHAFAWPEVYFPGYGWNEFSPYGDAATVARAPGEGGAGDAPVDFDPSLGGPPELDFPEDLDPFKGVSPSFTGSSGENPFVRFLPLLWGLLGLLAVAAVAGMGLRVAWEWGLGGLDYPSRLWEKTVRLATWMRIGPKPHQTPLEFSRSLSQTVHAEGVETLARGYQRSRYGHHDSTGDQDEQLSEAWRPLRNRLFKRLLRLKG